MGCYEIVEGQCTDSLNVHVCNVCLVHSLRTGTGTGSSTVQPLQIGRSSAENQIEGVTSAVGQSFNMQLEIETVKQ